MKRIIFTGKGGVGKTTILSNLARLLVRDGLQGSGHRLRSEHEPGHVSRHSYESHRISCR